MIDSFPIVYSLYCLFLSYPFPVFPEQFFCFHAVEIDHAEEKECPTNNVHLFPMISSGFCWID